MDKASAHLEKDVFLDTIMLAGTTFEAKEVVAVFILDVLVVKKVQKVASSFLTMKMVDLQSIFTKSILS